MTNITQTIGAEATHVSGTIKINFIAKTTKKDLLENFNDYLVKIGLVNLTNYNNETMELEIHEHDLTNLEEI